MLSQVSRDPLPERPLFAIGFQKEYCRRVQTTVGRRTNTTDENERSLISKLKLKCGAPYTSKLEGRAWRPEARQQGKELL